MGARQSSPKIEYSDVLDTKSGPIQGKVFTFDEDKYDAFLGIPYAQPPVGELRFKRPVPVAPWTETKECVTFGPRCPQKNDFIDKKLNIVGMDEAHCLSLNVVSPQSSEKRPATGYPVMVWIHGGGFAIHSSSNYGDRTVARNLCSKGVIFVSINYRLGVFGFFSTGDDVCKGNLGLWDQTLALQWVQENISTFGGDPNNVTIFGQSAGGASVDLLSLSPHSQNLFKRVIAMAGNAECSFAIRSKEDAASVSLKYAREIGWVGGDKDTESLMKFMSEQPTKSLIAVIAPEKNKYHLDEPGSMPFVPNYDGDFFPALISELRKRMPKKDIMTGTTEFEGLILSFFMKIPFTINGIEKALEFVIKESEYGSNSQKIRRQVAEFYTKGVDPKDRDLIRKKQVQFVGDSSICNGTVHYARTMSELGNNVYFYNFEFCNPDGYGLLGYLFPFKAATHGSELRYVLGKAIFMKFRPNADDLQMLDEMTTYFTNFAKYGNPNGFEDSLQQWVKHDSNHPFRFYNIHLPKSEMKDDYQDRRFEFWEKNVLSKNEAMKKTHEVL